MGNFRPRLETVDRGRRSVRFGLLLWLVPALLAAQATEIELKVEDEKGKALEGVRVTLQQVGGTKTITGTTNKKGTYRGPVDPAGRYTLRCEKDGFGAFSGELDLVEGMITANTIKLLDAAKAAQQAAVDAFNAGVGLLNSSKEAEALVKFKEAAERNPELAEAHRIVAAIEATNGNFAEARTALEAYERLRPGDTQLAAAAYEVYRQTNAPDQMAQARDLIKATPAGKEAAVRVYNDGVAKAKAKDEAGAAALFEEALVLDPGLAAAHQSLAAQAFNAKKWEAALAHLGSLLALDARNNAGLRMALFCHYELGHPAETEQALVAWFGAEPDQATKEVLAHANKLFESDDRAKARALVEPLLRAAPETPGVYFLLGRIHAAAGSPAEAKKALAKFLELAPNDADAALAKQMMQGL